MFMIEHNGAEVFTSPFRATLLVVWLFVRAACNDSSDWHLGYPDCGGDYQSPIDLSADVETVVKVSVAELGILPVHAVWLSWKLDPR